MIDPITREEILLAKALGENVPDIVPIIRKEMYLAKIAGADISTPEAITREEMYLDAIANGTECTLAPITRKEMFYAKAAGQDVQTPAPITRIEMLLSHIAGSGGGGEQPVYHTVKFYNGDVLLGSVQVLHGKSASYTGDTPVKGEGYEFNGWNPAPTNVTADMDCYAQYKNNNIYSWEYVLATIADGTYKDVYKLGDLVPIDLGSEGLINMQIIAFDADNLADGSGKAPITWLSERTLSTYRRMNPALAGSTGAYTEGTGSIGGWEKCELRSYMKETIKPLIPENVRNAIKPVTKTHNTRDTANAQVQQTTTDDVWIPDFSELYGTTSLYNDMFQSDVTRLPKKGQDDEITNYWTRSASSSSNFSVIGAGGWPSGAMSHANHRVVLGFCT